MKLWHFYLFGILGAAFLEICLLLMHDLTTWRPIEQQDEDQPILPKGMLKPLPMKAFAYVKSKNMEESKKEWSIGPILFEKKCNKSYEKAT